MGFYTISRAPTTGWTATRTLILLAGLTLVGADSDNARFDQLGHKLMCRCGCNQILLECNHVGCAYSDKMRQELIAGLETRDSDDLILQRFVQEYGAVVLAAATATGFNRVAWVTPFVALGAGIFAVVWIVRRWRGPGGRGPGAPPTAGTGLDPFRERARKETEL